MDGERGGDPKDENLRRIIETPTITTREELHEFYGRASYYRRLIPGFASNTKALSEAIAQKKTEFELTDAITTSMSWVVAQMNLECTVWAPDDSQPYHLTVAADFDGIVCVLSQTNENGCERPMAFASTMLTDAESRYTGVEKTMLTLRLGARK